MSDTPTAGGAPWPDRARKWIGPALLVSLVINLFLIGTVAAGFFFRHYGPAEDFGRVPPSFFRMLHRGVDGLPADDRAAMRRIMVREFPVIRPYFLKIESARKELAAAIGAEPYDPAGVKAAFARVDAAQAEMIAATRAAMVEGFGKLGPAQRARIAEMMRTQADHRMKERHRPRRPTPEKSEVSPSPLEPAERAPSASRPAPPPDPEPQISDALGVEAPPPSQPQRVMPRGAPASGLGFSGGTTAP